MEHVDTHVAFAMQIAFSLLLCASVEYTRFVGAYAQPLDAYRLMS